MADNSHIEWTDATWNPITGCSIVSPGCTNCYAMRLAGTRLKHHPSREGLTRDTKAGPVWTGEVRFNEQWLTQPIEWKRPRKIFVCAHGDLFAEGVPYEWIDQVFAVMARARQHEFQVLTKRADRMRAYCDPREGPASKRISRLAPDVLVRWPLPNVWLGVSAERQKEADERIPLLLETPAAIRFVSLEPLLGPIDLIGTLARWQDETPWSSRSVIGLGRQLINWVIVGGESGKGARPMHPDWARSLRDQCAAAGMPFLFKQWGAWGPAWEAEGAGEPHTFPDGHVMRRVGKKDAGRALDGQTHDEFPAVPT